MEEGGAGGALWGLEEVGAGGAFVGGTGYNVETEVTVETMVVGTCDSVTQVE